MMIVTSTIVYVYANWRTLCWASTSKERTSSHVLQYHIIFNELAFLLRDVSIEGFSKRLRVSERHGASDAMRIIPPEKPQ